MDHLQETSAKVVPYSSQVQQDDTELLTTGGIEQRSKLLNLLNNIIDQGKPCSGSHDEDILIFASELCYLYMSVKLNW